MPVKNEFAPLVLQGYFVKGQNTILFQDIYGKEAKPIFFFEKNFILVTQVIHIHCRKTLQNT